MTPERLEQITVYVCGPKRSCPDGTPHDDKGLVTLYGSSGEPCGESVACSKCGSSAFERDLWEAP